MDFLAVRPDVTSVFLVLVFAGDVGSCSGIHLIVEFITDIIHITPYLQAEVVRNVQIGSGRCHSAITLVATEHAVFQPVGILSPFTDGTISILFNPVLCHHIAVGIPRFKVFSVSAHVYATWETVQADQRIQIIAAGSRGVLDGLGH